MKPVSIKRDSALRLRIVWDDGHVGLFDVEVLRDGCPCAGCSGETVLMREYVPPPPDRSTPGRYELVSITPVGNYAVQIGWKDGHTTGIYTWEHLLSLCSCEKCRENKHR